ncbi:MAG: DUF4330 family protein [Oscillospiraceae bacterium]|nr:DUF4330 family protein [Oscillospiraceae bacterium]
MKRRFIDENGRIFGTVSAIDVLVIIVVVILAAAIYLKFNVKEATVTDAGEDIKFEVLVNYVRGSAYDSVRVGDDIYSGTEKIGTIADIKLEPSTFNFTCADGSIKKVTNPARCDVTLTIEAYCTVNDGTYYTSNQIPLNYRAELSLNTKYNTFSGYILGVTE